MYTKKFPPKWGLVITVFVYRSTIIFHRLLVAPDGGVCWANVHKLAGRKIQKVATRAYAMECFQRALSSPNVALLTKVRLLAAAQPGAGEWLCLMAIAYRTYISACTTMSLREASSRA